MQLHFLSASPRSKKKSKNDLLTGWYSGLLVHAVLKLRYEGTPTQYNFVLALVTSLHQAGGAPPEAGNFSARAVGREAASTPSQRAGARR